MIWDKYECEGCKRRFAIEQPEGDEIEEPICPSCGGTYSKHLGEVDEPDGKQLELPL